MIGRNGHMRWPEAYDLICNLWSILPDKYKWNHLLNRHEKIYENWDCSLVGFEGIRSQDILPLLIKYFNFELFYAFGNIVDIFVDRCFGPNFDPRDSFDLAFIDFVAKLDEIKIAEGCIKPTHIMARLKARAEPNNVMKIIDNLTPEFCMRNPSGEIEADRRDQRLPLSDNLREPLDNISILERQLAESSDRVKLLENEISEINQSIIWQLVTIYHNGFVERLLPNGSNQRKRYDLGIKRCRVLMKEVFRNRVCV